MLVQIVANRHRVKLERNAHHHQRNRCDNVVLNDTNSSTARDRKSIEFLARTYDDYYLSHVVGVIFP